MIRWPRALFRRWWRSAPPWRWGLLSFTFLVMGAGLYTTTRSMSYVENDPEFCRSCHVMEEAWDRWATSVHREVTCHSCHEQSALASMELVVKFALNRPNQVGTHAGISDEACLKCHGSGSPQWRQVAQTAGHEVHFEDQRISCTKCHSITLHRFEPPAKVCLVCHPDEEVKMTRMADRYCLDCHEFLRPASPLRPLRQTCLDCHQEQAQTKVHWPENAPMRFVCSVCHKPHEQTKPEVQCETCHTAISQVGKHTVSTHQQVACSTCHEPHEWEVERRDTCLTCHQDRATHNQGAFCADCHSFNLPTAASGVALPFPTPSQTLVPEPPVPAPTPAPGETPPPTPTTAPTATPRPVLGPPGVPHSLEGRAQCLACHGSGIAGATRVPDNHAGRTDATCLACHEAASNSQ